MATILVVDDSAVDRKIAGACVDSAPMARLTPLLAISLPFQGGPRSKPRTLCAHLCHYCDAGAASGSESLTPNRTPGRHPAGGL